MAIKRLKSSSNQEIKEEAKRPQYTLNYEATSLQVSENKPYIITGPFVKTTANKISLLEMSKKLIGCILLKALEKIHPASKMNDNYLINPLKKLKE